MGRLNISKLIDQSTWVQPACRIFHVIIVSSCDVCSHDRDCSPCPSPRPGRTQQLCRSVPPSTLAVLMGKLSESPYYNLRLQEKKIAPFMVAFSLKKKMNATTTSKDRQAALYSIFILGFRHPLSVKNVFKLEITSNLVNRFCRQLLICLIGLKQIIMKQAAFTLNTIVNTFTCILLNCISRLLGLLCH